MPRRQKPTPDERPPAVSLHRFRDSAALSVLRAQGTVYLSVVACRTLARDLARLARSLESEAFVDSEFRAESVPAVATSGEGAAFPPSAKRFPRPQVRTFSAPSAWASYLINDDGSGLESNEFRAARAFRDSLPGSVSGCESVGFLTYHDARDLFPFASDCSAFSVLVYPTPKPKAKPTGVTL